MATKSITIDSENLRVARDLSDGAEYPYSPEEGMGDGVGCW